MWTSPQAASRCRKDAAVDFARISRLAMSACGTAHYAGLIGKYWFEKIARLPVDIDIASEFRYRETPLERDGLGALHLAIGRDGGHARGAALLRRRRPEDRRRRQRADVHHRARVDYVLPTLAGPEIGVASTKAFTCQLTVLFALAVAAARQRGAIDAAEEERLV